MSYNTKQKDKILEIIQKQEKQFTVKDIYNDLNKEIGLTTIYRLIDNLVDTKRLNKYIGKDNITYYEYLEKCENNNHFFLKCDKCGRLIHIDCDCIIELYNHILKKHNFIPNKENIIINGICNNCINKGEI